MKSMGIDMYEIEGVKQVIIKTADKDIVFNDAQVTVIDARGQKMYQLVGTPEERPVEKEVPRRISCWSLSRQACPGSWQSRR